MFKKINLIFSIFIGITGSLILILAIGYSIKNKSGHTSLNPYDMILPFLFFVILGCVNLYRKQKRIGKPLIVIGLLGIILPILWDLTNILNEYNHWCKEGLPLAPSYRIPLMLIYGGGLVLYCLHVLLKPLIKTKT